MSIIKNSIFTQAIELGFDFSTFSDDTTVAEIEGALIEFFNENSEKLPQTEDECEVTSSGRYQNVNYGDFTSSGEIVNFSDNWNKAPKTKVFHSSFPMLDGDKFVNVNLYYLVGETDYNAPEGYWFNPKTKSHEIFEA